jgi:hypothetical protein
MNLIYIFCGREVYLNEKNNFVYMEYPIFNILYGVRDINYFVATVSEVDETEAVNRLEKSLMFLEHEKRWFKVHKVVNTRIKADFQALFCSHLSVVKMRELIK